MLLEEEYWPEKGTTFKSGIHSKTIDLYGFTEFLFTYGESSIEEMKTSSNFQYMKETIRAIADGMNIWDGKTEIIEYRNRYLYCYAALPSTNIMVEKFVKKAKLCQQIGM